MCVIRVTSLLVSGCTALERRGLFFLFRFFISSLGFSSAPERSIPAPLGAHSTGVQVWTPLIWFYLTTIFSFLILEIHWARIGRREIWESRIQSKAGICNMAWKANFGKDSTLGGKIWEIRDTGMPHGLAGLQRLEGIGREKVYIGTCQHL